MFLKQEWVDARIKIPEEMFEMGDDSITLNSDYFDNLWQPDLYFLNSKVVGKHLILFFYQKTLIMTFRNCKFNRKIFICNTISQ